MMKSGSSTSKGSKKIEVEKKKETLNNVNS